MFVKIKLNKVKQTIKVCETKSKKVLLLLLFLLNSRISSFVHLGCIVLSGYHWIALDLFVHAIQDPTVEIEDDRWFPYTPM